MFSRYYQPNPLAPTPFSVVSSLNDPNFSASCSGYSGNCAEAWGLRIINSQNILAYGVGLYSFFNNYDTSMFSIHLSPPSSCLLSPINRPKEPRKILTQKSMFQRRWSRKLSNQYPQSRGFTIKRQYLHLGYYRHNKYDYERWKESSDV